MAAPLSTERTFRTLLQALKFGGFFTNEASVRAIESVNANATDADITNVVSGLSYGNAPISGGVFASDADIDLLLDSDSLPVTPHTNRLRVSIQATTTPVTDEDQEIFTVGKTVNALTDRPVDVTIGPDYTIATKNHRAHLYMGSNPAGYYGTVRAGDDVSHSAGAAFTLGSPDAVELWAPDVLVTDGSGTARGGFTDTAAESRLQVGNVDTSNSLITEVENDVTYGDMFNIRPALTGYVAGQSRRIFIRGSDAADDYGIHVAVGGKLNELWGDPSLVGNYSTMMVVSNALNDSRQTLKLKSRHTQWSVAGRSIFVIEDDVSNPALSAGYYLLRIFQNCTALFSIDKDGVCHCPGGFDGNPA